VIQERRTASQCVTLPGAHAIEKWRHVRSCDKMNYAKRHKQEPGNAKDRSRPAKVIHVKSPADNHIFSLTPPLTPQRPQIQVDGLSMISGSGVKHSRNGGAFRVRLGKVIWRMARTWLSFGGPVFFILADWALRAAALTPLLPRRGFELGRTAAVAIAARFFGGRPRRFVGPCKTSIAPVSRSRSTNEQCEYLVSGHGFDGSTDLSDCSYYSYRKI
jgi:hypothetical protein